MSNGNADHVAGAQEGTLRDIRDKVIGAGSSTQLVRDMFTGGEILADQAGAGGVLTFTFSSPVQLVWAKADAVSCRADPFGGTPTSTFGIPLADGVPNPITVQTSEVKVFAPTGATVHIWGFRY